MKDYRIILINYLVVPINHLVSSTHSRDLEIREAGIFCCAGLKWFIIKKCGGERQEWLVEVEREGIEWRNGKESAIAAHIPTPSSIEKYIPISKLPMHIVCKIAQKCMRVMKNNPFLSLSLENIKCCNFHRNFQKLIEIFISAYLILTCKCLILKSIFNLYT